MSLELHVWGQAFGLPSIDPDCLGAITYFSLAVPRDAWTLVATSPSAVPRNLPALRDGRSRRWVAAGFEDIVAYLRDGARARARAATAGLSITDLDAGLTPSQAADSAAYCAFLHAEAAPLLSLSLYVSSANWSATTRPAYSHVLPFPLTWIEPVAVRAEHSAGAAHLGFSSLDTDADDDDERSSSSALSFSSSLSAAALQVFPDRLRTVRNREGEGGAGPGAAGKKKKLPGPSSMRASTASTRVTSALTPEAKAQIRLDDTARTCLCVLAKRKGGKRLFLRPDSDGLRPTSLDCLAFAHLALMVVPAVPRPFLDDALRRHHPDLGDFVADMRQAAFGGDRSMASLPWRQPEPPLLSCIPATSHILPSPRYLNPLWLRTVHGVVHGIPGLSGEWIVWLYRLIRMGGSDEVDEVDEAGTQANALNPWRQDVAAARRQRAVALCTTLTGAALAVGLLMEYRNLPPFGAPVVVFGRPSRISLLGLGAAGAILSSL